MLSQFLKDKCTIKRKQTSVSSGGVSSISLTTIYDQIPCQVSSVWWSVYDSTLAVYTKKNSTKVRIQKQYTDIQQGDIVVVHYFNGDDEMVIKERPQQTQTLRWVDSIYFIATNV